MEKLAKTISNKIDNICGGYHYYKDENVLERSRDLAGEIQQFCGVFLQGNIFGMEEEEYRGLRQFVIEVLEDYMEGVRQRDLVLMLDTLDYGLRELLNLYIDTDTGADGNG